MRCGESVPSAMRCLLRRTAAETAPPTQGPRLVHIGAAAVRTVRTGHGRRAAAHRHTAFQHKDENTSAGLAAPTSTA